MIFLSGGYGLYIESRIGWYLFFANPKARALRRCHAIEVLVGRVSMLQRYSKEQKQATKETKKQTIPPNNHSPYTSTRNVPFSTKNILHFLWGFSAWKIIGKGGTWSFLCSVELGWSWRFACLLVSESPSGRGRRKRWCFSVGYGRVDRRHY